MIWSLFSILVSSCMVATQPDMYEKGDAVLAVLVLTVPPFGVSFLRSWFEHRAALRKYREDQANERQRQVRHQRESLEHAGDQVESASFAALKSFEALSSRLDQAQRWGVEAQRHFANGAFSPFWQAIENAYACLGEYNVLVSRIEQCSKTYQEAVLEWGSLGGRGDVTPFPIDPNSARAAEACESLSKKLGSVVYTAQQSPVFAQIWEQRRTTSAVVAGFATLDLAVQRMTNTLSGSVQSLTSAVGGMDSQVRTIASQSVGLDASRRQDQQQVADRMDKAVYYLKQADKRALGW